MMWPFAHDNVIRLPPAGAELAGGGEKDFVALGPTDDGNHADERKGFVGAGWKEFRAGSLRRKNFQINARGQSRHPAVGQAEELPEMRGDFRAGGEDVIGKP